MAAIAEETSALSLSAQLRTLDRVYWIANAMEMVERLAYYGLRTVLPIYMVLSVQKGGPEFTHVQKGEIFALWAAVQSFLPIFTGGYADRYGYKLTVAVSVAIKIAGYLVMGFTVPVAAWLTDGGSATAPGHPAVYWTFLAGAALLAAGTAIFKPGLQGIIAVRLSAGNAGLGWALFYMLVNVGAFVGPYLASVMRLVEWRWVFVSCAAIVALNYLLLLTFREPERLTRELPSFLRVLWNSLIGIFEPRLGAFLVVFSGFWMMFHQLFDLLPNFITDWVDSGVIVRSVVAPLFALAGATIPEEWNGQLPAEQIVNVNAGLIMCFAFAVGFLTGKVRSMTAMIAGILVSAVAVAGFSMSSAGPWVVLMIALFSFGEMAASPTKMRYVANIAPPGRTGLYLGYVNATQGIGWSIGSLVAGEMYQAGGDKVVLARRHLVEVLGRDAAGVEALPKDDVLPVLAAALRATPDATREVLWQTWHPERIWLWFAFVGIVSMVGMIAFDLITRRRSPYEPWLLLGLTVVVSAVTYDLRWAAGFGAAMGLYLALRRYAPRALPD